jgi:hypothetical protein
MGPEALSTKRAAWQAMRKTGVAHIPPGYVAPATEDSSAA